MSEQIDGVNDMLTSALSGDVEGILGKVLDTDTGLLAQFSGLSRSAWNCVGTLCVLIDVCDAVLSDVTTSDSVTGTYTFGTTLAEITVQSLANVVDRYVANDDSTTAEMCISVLSSKFATLVENAGYISPTMTTAEKTTLATRMTSAAAVSSTYTSQQTQTQAIDLPSLVQVACASRLALRAAALYKNDDLLRAEATAQKDQNSFDVLGQYTPQDDIEVMSADALENTLAVVRTDIQTAVDGSRASCDTLKTMADQLQQHVDRVKLTREHLTTVRIAQAMPVHLLCLRYGLGYNDAERMLELNSVVNPDFMQGEVRVYV